MMKFVVLDQSRTVVAILLASSLAVTCGCEVHVAMGIGDEASDSSMDLVSGRLERSADESRESASADPSTAVPKKITRSEGQGIRPVSAWRAGRKEKPGEDATASFPVDLPTALRLAGAQNWNIELAAERVREARAAVDAAEAMWMPSLIGGMGYTQHSGQLQATSGSVTDVRRSSVFVGGGARTGMAPLAGGGGGPLRMSVDLSLADAIFQPLVARQQLDVVRARETVVFNDTLRNAALAYLALVEAQGQRANRRADLDDASALLRQ
ncbi:MAG TPA: hypothetical protein DIC23_11255, partial [Planctomycetaceae bacterium]|nr:hypothetical protein [Planctomycetaceae bacterium]